MSTRANEIADVKLPMFDVHDVLSGSRIPEIGAHGEVGFGQSQVCLV